MGYQAASSLLDNIFHGGCVDDYLQDQVPFFFEVFISDIQNSMDVNNVKNIFKKNYLQ